MISETEYFTLTLKSQRSGKLFASLSRKRSVLAGATPELIDVLAAYLTTPAKSHAVQVDPKDLELTTDLMALGLVPGRPRGTLIWTGKLIHDPTYRALDWMRALKTRDRTIWGVTEAPYAKVMPKPRGAWPKNPLPQKLEKLRKLEKFSEAVLHRRSACGFGAQVSRDRLCAVLTESLSERIDGSHAFAVSGSIATLRVWCAIDGVAALKDGIHLFNPQSHAFEKLKGGSRQALIERASFNQPAFLGCGTWLIIGYAIEPLTARYGTRAFRFAFLNSGGLLQQIALSAASFGLDFRVLGGFDERIIESTLGLPSSEWLITAMAGVGLSLDT